MEVPLENYLSIDEAAEYTRLSHSTIRRAINGGSLRATHIVGRYRLLRSDVDAGMNGGRS